MPGFGQHPSAGLVVGGRWPHPGKEALANRGPPYLSELTEFDASRLEVMRQSRDNNVLW